jgi:hypothetical protein
MTTNSFSMIDILADWYHTDPHSGIAECYFPIGECLYRYYLLKEKVPQKEDKELLKALRHGYWVLDLINKKETYTLLRYNESSTATDYTIEDIINLNNRLREVQLNNRLPKVQYSYDKEPRELFLLILKTGEFVIEFSQLICSLLFIINQKEIFNDEGNLLRNKLDKANLFDKADPDYLIKILPFPPKIKHILNCLNMRRNMIVKFNYEKINQKFEKILELIEQSIEYAKTLKTRLL